MGKSICMGVVSLAVLSLLAIIATACGGETGSVQEPQEAKGVGSIEGTVRYAGGEPAQALVLTITSGSAPFPKMAPLSNAEGFYSFPGIPVGTFEVAVHDDQGNKVVVQSVEVKAGEAAAADFILPLRTRSNSGWITTVVRSNSISNRLSS